MLLLLAARAAVVTEFGATYLRITNEDTACIGVESILFLLRDTWGFTAPVELLIPTLLLGLRRPITKKRRRSFFS